MTTLTTIDIGKEDLKFSAAHFTIFSATERERLHGHNFRVYLSLTAPVGDNGMCFSYKEIKSRLRQLCAALDEYTLLPGNSPYIELRDAGDSHELIFNGESMRFLKSDTQVLPMRNTTVEEFASYLLSRLLEDTEFIKANAIEALILKVSSGPGQRGSASWRREA